MLASKQHFKQGVNLLQNLSTLSSSKLTTLSLPLYLTRNETLQLHWVSSLTTEQALNSSVCVSSLVRAFFSFPIDTAWSWAYLQATTMNAHSLILLRKSPQALGALGGRGAALVPRTHTHFGSLHESPLTVDEMHTWRCERDKSFYDQK